MEPHHRDTIRRTADFFQAQPSVQALILGGSIAHGLAAADSDVDIMIVVSDDEHRRRLAENDVQFFTKDLATYPDGYIDGKYISRSFLDDVERRGSEPARFAFADAQVLFSRFEGLEAQLARIARYPVEEKEERIRRFVAQLHAWHWYAGEAERKQNAYMMCTACGKLALFGGRLVLAHNELLYPYHKWFRAILTQAQQKPDGLLDLMEEITARPSYAAATAWYTLITGFRAWETDAGSWANRFMRDSEVNWMDGATPVDDM